MKKLAMVLGFVVVLVVAALAQDYDDDDEDADSSAEEFDVTAEENDEECPRFCPMHNDPVCAINSRGDVNRFSNDCLLVAHNCLNDDDYSPVDDVLCPSPLSE